MTANVTLTFAYVPKAYMWAGSCPRCGAPLYHDAATPLDENGFVTSIPLVFYSCLCRLMSGLSNVVQPTDEFFKRNFFGSGCVTSIPDPAIRAYNAGVGHTTPTTTER